MFINKLWLGEFSLAKTYWLFYVIVWGLFSLPIRWFSATTERLQAEYANIAMISLCLFVAYGSIALVGLWRSASKYQGSKLWSVLAKIIVCIGVLIQIFTILALGNSTPIFGGILFLTAIIPFISFYLFKKVSNKKYALIIIVMIVLIIPILWVSARVNQSVKSNWMPLLKSSTYDFSTKKEDFVTTYVDFNSIVVKDGYTYAYRANEFDENGVFKKTVKHYAQFDCSVPRFRVLSAISYPRKVGDGFGDEISRKDNYQAELAKLTVENKQAYTGGWETYDSLLRDEFNYCEKAPEKDVSKFLCGSSKRDLVVLRTVCGNK